MADVTSTKRMISGSVLRVLTLLLNIVIVFLMMPFIIHSIGDKWYGLWAIIINLVGYYSVLDFGLSSATQRFVSRAIATDDKKEINSYINTSFILFGVISIVCILATVVAYISGRYFFTEELELNTYEWTVLILGASTALSFPFFVFVGLIKAHIRYDLLSYIEILKTILRALGIYIVLSAGSSIVAMAAVTMASEMMSWIAYLLVAKRISSDLRISRKYIDFEKMRTLFHYGKYIFISGIGDKLRFSADNFVIAAFRTLSDVTHYAIAARLISYYNELMMNVLSTAMPVFTMKHAKGDLERLKENYLKVTEVSIFLSMMLGGCMIVFGYDFIVLWMGDDYGDAYLILLIIGLAITISSSQIPTVTLLNAMAKHKYYSLMNLVEAGFNITLSIILVIPYGIVGVAAGTAIPLAISKLIIQPMYMCKQVDMRKSSYYRMLTAKYFMGIMLHAIMSPVVIGYLNIESMSQLVLCGIVYFVVYLLIGVRFMLEPGTRRQIIDNVPPRLLGVVRLLIS